MTVEEAIELIDLVLAQKRLSDVQEHVFRQCWEGLKYPEIAWQLGYDDAYLRRVGSELWRLLSEGFGERITKSNFRSVLSRYRASTLHSKDEPVSKQAVTSAGTPEGAIAPSPSSTTFTDPNFVGREGAIAHLKGLVSQGTKIITIYAPGGVGKTTLAWQYLHNQGFDKILEIWMAKEIQNINSVESEVERWLQQNFGEEPGRDFGVNLERLRQKLRDPNQQIGILIDNLEPALDRNGLFVETRRAYVDLLRVLSDPGARSLTLITSRERLCEPSIHIKDYRLEGLDKASWQEFFNNHGIQTSSPVLAEMHHAYGGNAKAMQILSSTIQIDFEGNLETFWKENQTDLLLDSTLENLVSEQFSRLQVVYPEAYRLLCRLGCFRYQDVPTVPFKGLLHLSWDIPQMERKKVIKALENRSLIEAKNSEYHLHPVIRGEAIQRLRQSSDWKLINQKLAEFWTGVVVKIEDIDDSIKALEAYYHYFEVQDFKAASNVILKERINRLQENEDLGQSLKRLGLIKTTISAIEKIIGKVESNYSLAKLYNRLGDLNWVLGNIHKAIQYHETSKKIADDFGFKKLILFSLQDIAICKTELGEIDEATKLFEDIAERSQEKSEFYSFAIFSWAYIAFLKSLRQDKENDREELLALLKKIWNEFYDFSFTIQAVGYSLLLQGLTYKNLGEFEIAFNALDKTLSFSKDLRYKQVEGKSLIGLAEIHREKGELKTALQNYLEAISILAAIGAKCDLAEAYFQLGLTYRVMGEVERGLEYRDKAIQLFEEMEAPRQVERVQQAFASSDG